MGTRLTVLVVFLCLFISPTISIPQSHAAIDAPCPNGDSDCDLCGGETCLNSGFCGWAGTLPCKLSCTTCQQNGGTTTCVEDDQECDDMVGSCWNADCDANSDWLNNPTGCEFTYNPAPPECQACDTCGNGICEESEVPETCFQDCVEPAPPGEPIGSCGPVDLPGLPTLNCDDGLVCTDDVCVKEAPTAISGQCSYPPKACSGATQDFCCPAACSDDSNSPNFDTDCCSPVPTPSPSPSPDPTPIPSPTPPATPEASPSPTPTPPATPAASPTPSPTPPATPQATPSPSTPPEDDPGGDNSPNPSQPGENTIPNAAGQLFLSGGACQLHTGLGNVSGWGVWNLVLISAILTVALRSRRSS